MNIRHELQRLPAPDPQGEERVLARFRDSRARQRPASRVWWAVVPALAAAALALALLPRDAPRTRALHASGAAEQLTWSDTVQLEFTGHGSIVGTSRDVQLRWDQGRLAVQVAPDTDTALSIVTDEAEIAVVGTAFTVERDLLGVTVEVTQGRVAVTCGDGWSGHLVGETGAHTCLPLSPAGLMARADALMDRAASSEAILATLDLGLDHPEARGAVRAELQARRMHARAALGQTRGALEDADGYLASGEAGRAVEVRRFASRIALYGGCTDAMPYLLPLQEGGSAEDAVLLAECLAATDPEGARALLVAAIADLESAWLVRAKDALANLERR